MRRTETTIHFMKKEVNPKRGQGLAPLVDAFKKAGARVSTNGSSVVVSLDTADPRQKDVYKRYSMGKLTAVKPSKKDPRKPLCEDRCLLPGG